MYNIIEYLENLIKIEKTTINLLRDIVDGNANDYQTKLKLKLKIDSYDYYRSVLYTIQNKLEKAPKWWREDL